MTGDPLARPPVPPLEDLATMARTLADDGWLPIGERAMAAVVGDRLRLQLRVSADDALRVRWLFVQRRAALARLLSSYDQRAA